MSHKPSKDYQKRKLELTLLATLLEFLGLFAFLFSGWNIHLRNILENRIGSHFLILSPFYILIIAIIHEVLFFPFAFIKGYRLEHRYHLSNQKFLVWMKDHLKSMIIGWILGLGAILCVYSLLRLYPVGWWWRAGLVLWVIYVFLVKFAPLFLFPLFFKFKPLQDEILKNKILEITKTAGVHVKGVYEFDMSRKTKSVNAAITGLGSTCRILLADNLLSHFTQEEIMAVVAHELGHHKHRHLVKGIFFNFILLLLFLFASEMAIRESADYFQFRSPADMATFPLIALVFSIGSLLFLPITNAILRSFERHSDRFALETTRNPAAFISMMEKLSNENLAEDSPHPIIEFLFHSHPSAKKRVALAQSYLGPIFTPSREHPEIRGQSL
ncbi:M48 family metalloprotease [Candidatus Sumerlaeota bacterium]|nr:M48 family metalloprotease [Candidatus Sumerlaeota bacterium]